jgi:predicted Zn-dependent protease
VTEVESIDAFVADTWGQAQEDLAKRRWNRTFQSARAVSVTMPGIARPMLVCGMCASQLGIPGSALTMIRRSSMAAPDDPMVVTRLAEVLYAAGRFLEAEQSARKTLRLGASAGEGNFLLARILWAQGKTIDARAALDIAVEHDPAIAEKRRILEYTVGPELFG